MSLCCPLCSVPLAASALEAHLRFELGLPLLSCLLCQESFCDRPSAAKHFNGPFAKHPGAPPRLIQPPDDEAKTGRLLELLRLAQGGEAAVQRRLCVCGHCRLLCREEFRPTSDAQRSSYSAKAQSHSLVEQHAHQQIRAEPAALAPPSWPPEASKEESGLPTEAKRPTDDDDKAPLPPEASEEEAAMSVDVKPNLADLKPQLASDGRVACLQCGTRADKNHFSDHAYKAHMPGKPFQCLLCSHKTKVRFDLVKHQRKDHGTELSTETFISSLNKEALKDWVKLCFGEAKDVGYAGLRCRPCDVHVITQKLKHHVATHHLKKALHKCRECGRKTNEFGVQGLRKHVAKEHKGVNEVEAIDSSALEQYEPIIKAMIPQLFVK